MPQILMPALSPTMEEGKLSKWLVKVGDTVSSGDVLAEIETDKATMEVESIDSGVVKELLVAEGTEGVLVNTPIALILAEGETEAAAPVAKTAPEPAEAPVVAAEKAAEAAPSQASVPAAPKFQAENDPDLPAGVEMVEMTVRQALNEAMAEELRRDPDVFVLGEEVAEYQGAYKITQNLLQEFGPQRIIDTPITEHGFAGLAVGAAFAGLKPIVEFMTWNFAMQAIDQIINSAAKQLYMSGGQVKALWSSVVRTASRRALAPSTGQDYSAWYSTFPASPSSRPTALPMPRPAQAAIRSPNPVVFLENEVLYGSTASFPRWTLPAAHRQGPHRRKGADVTIVSFSMGMRYATQATEKLVAAGSMWN